MSRRTSTVRTIRRGVFGGSASYSCSLGPCWLDVLCLIQAIDKDHGAGFLKKQGAMRAVRLAEIPAYRGLITDRRGEPLAVSTPVVSLWANPQHLRDSDRLRAWLMPWALRATTLEAKLARYADKQFMYLARSQTPIKRDGCSISALSGCAASANTDDFTPRAR